MAKLRKIEFKPNVAEPSKTGYFHGFFEEVINDGDYKMSKPVALVEYENGEVKVLEPQNIRFVSPPK